MIPGGISLEDAIEAIASAGLDSPQGRPDFPFSAFVDRKKKLRFQRFPMRACTTGRPNDVRVWR
jgi:hypothetical protein